MILRQPKLLAWATLKKIDLAFCTGGYTQVRLPASFYLKFRLLFQSFKTESNLPAKFASQNTKKMLAMLLAHVQYRQADLSFPVNLPIECKNFIFFQNPPKEPEYRRAIWLPTGNFFAPSLVANLKKIPWELNEFRTTYRRKSVPWEFWLPIANKWSLSDTMGFI